MVHYKLHYFDIYGRGEPGRQLFALADVPFEDARYTPEQFAALKETFPFKQVPVLEVDGELLPQSVAIYRYLARQFGYAGNGDLEQAQVDAVADLFQDYYNEFRSYFPVAVGMQPGDKDFLFNSVMVPARNKMLRILSEMLRSNGTGYLVGRDVTFVDLMLSVHVDGMEKIVPGFANDFPRILQHRDRINAIPRLAKYLAERPPAPF